MWATRCEGCGGLLEGSSREVHLQISILGAVLAFFGFNDFVLAI